MSDLLNFLIKKMNTTEHMFTCIINMRMVKKSWNIAIFRGQKTINPSLAARTLAKSDFESCKRLSNFKVKIGLKYCFYIKTPKLINNTNIPLFLSHFFTKGVREYNRSCKYNSPKCFCYTGYFFEVFTRLILNTSVNF